MMKWLIVFMIGVAVGATGLGFAYIAYDNHLTGQLQKLAEQTKVIEYRAENIDRRTERIEGAYKLKGLNQQDLKNIRATVVQAVHGCRVVAYTRSDKPDLPPAMQIIECPPASPSN